MASLDNQSGQEVQELKQKVRQVIKRLTPTSEPRASIESNQHTMQYVRQHHKHLFHLPHLLRRLLCGTADS